MARFTNHIGGEVDNSHPQARHSGVGKESVKQKTLGNGVTVARLTLDQLVKVQILIPQLFLSPFDIKTIIFFIYLLPKHKISRHITGVMNAPIF